MIVPEGGGTQVYKVYTCMTRGFQINPNKDSPFLGGKKQNKTKQKQKTHTTNFSVVLQSNSIP